MDTLVFSAALQVGLGGALMFLMGILIGRCNHCSRTLVTIGLPLTEMQDVENDWAVSTGLFELVS
jgi:hypothetical protein